MKEISVRAGQTLQDIALQEYGTVTATILLLVDNDIGVDTQLYVGQVLKVRDEVPELTETNRATQRKLATEDILPNRGSTVVQPPSNSYVEDDYITPDYLTDTN